jgi:hypothetical protein
VTIPAPTEINSISRVRNTDLGHGISSKPGKDVSRISAIAMLWVARKENAQNENLVYQLGNS